MSQLDEPAEVAVALGGVEAAGSSPSKVTPGLCALPAACAAHSGVSTNSFCARHTHHTLAQSKAWAAHGRQAPANLRAGEVHCRRRAHACVGVHACATVHANVEMCRSNVLLNSRQWLQERHQMRAPFKQRCLCALWPPVALRLIQCARWVPARWKVAPLRSRLVHLASVTGAA